MAVGVKSVAVQLSLTSASALVSRIVSSRLLAPSIAESLPSVQSGNVVATSLTSANMKGDEVLHEDSKDVKVVVEALGLGITPNAS